MRSMRTDVRKEKPVREGGDVRGNALESFGPPPPLQTRHNDVR